jgi:uncharacterized membrane protein
MTKGEAMKITRLLEFALLTFSISVGAATPVYRIAEFPHEVNGLYWETPQGINDNKQLVGTVLNGETYDAYFWDATTGSRVKLPRLAYTTFIDRSCVAHDISNKGKVVGHCGAEGGRKGIAVVWNDGVAKALQRFPGQIQSFAQAINGNGQIAGYFTGVGTTAGRWIAGDALELGLPQGAEKSSYSHDINDQGNIVGFFADAAADPVLWRAYVFKPATGVYTFLHTRTSGFAIRTAAAINNVGRIVGEDAGRAVAWNKDTLNVRVLPFPTSDGICCSAALDINDRDEVIGWGEPVQKGERDLYLVKASVVYRLKHLLTPENPVSSCVKFDTFSAVLNNNGVIVSSGTNQCTGVSNIYILTPKTT